MRIVKVIATWTLQILLATLFVMIGVMKFVDPSWARNFARWGYPAGFHAVVGVLEAGGGAALLVPQAAPYAAAELMVIMVGAAATHLVHGETRRFTAPVAYLLLLAIVAWVRRPARRKAGVTGATDARSRAVV